MIPNRTGFLKLESTDMPVDELWACTGFARCDDCGYLMRTQTLVTLPEHRCTWRQAARRAADLAPGATP